MYFKLFSIITIAVLLMLTACSSGSNGFHLRNKITLADKYKRVAVKGVERDSEQFQELKFALQEAGSEVIHQPETSFAGSVIEIRNLRENRRIIAYDSGRKVREYLLYLKFDYLLNKSNANSDSKLHHISIDRAFLYDSNFVLGKSEEEKLIRKGLRKEAARLILLKIKATDQ